MLRDGSFVEKKDNRYSVPALEKGLGLLEMFGEHRGELSFSDICERTAMPKASAYRTLHTLERLGFLARSATGGYALGISVLRLGFDYLSSMDIVQIGQPVIDRLRDNTGCSAHLCVLDGRDVVYVARAAASGEIGAGVSVGSRLPLVRLTTLYPDEVFELASDRGPTTSQQLFDLLEQDRVRGFAVSESFYQPGVSAVAYPLRDRSGGVLASVNVMSPRHALPQDLKTLLCEEVAKSACEIERFLHVC
jgi:DNA-binding IclR family transcriptional regulator